MAQSGSLWVKSRMYSLTSTMLRMQYLTYSLYDDIAMGEGPMTSAIHGKVRQPLNEIQNVQSHQYHAFLVRMQYSHGPEVGGANDMGYKWQSQVASW